MKKIGYEYCDYYYLMENGVVYNSQIKEYIESDKNRNFKLKTISGEKKKVSLKVLYFMVFSKHYCEDDICDLEGEEWREIDNTNGLYFVSNKGRIKSYNRYKAIIMKPRKTNNGYYRVDIIQDGIRVSKLIHRLVGVTFLGMPQKIDMELHHKDFNKENNNCENLEWITSSEHKKIHRERNQTNE